MKKHVCAIDRAPPTMKVLQIAGAMQKHHCRPAALPIRRRVDASVNCRAVARFETGDGRIDPVVSEELRNGRSRHRFIRDQRLSRGGWPISLQVQLRRLVTIRTHSCEHPVIMRDIDLVVPGPSRHPPALASAYR